LHASRVTIQGILIEIVRRKRQKRRFATGFLSSL